MQILSASASLYIVTSNLYSDCIRFKTEVSITGLLLVPACLVNIVRSSRNIALAVNSICIDFWLDAHDMLERKSWKADCKSLKHSGCICTALS